MIDLSLFYGELSFLSYGFSESDALFTGVSRECRQDYVIFQSHHHERIRKQITAIGGVDWPTILNQVEGYIVL